MALTKNLAIYGHRRYAQAATITASSEQPAYPAQALSLPGLWGNGVTWRSRVGDVSGVSLLIDLGATLPALGPSERGRIVELVGVNFSDSATWTVTLSDHADLSAPVNTPASAAVFNLTLPSLIPYTPPWGRPAIYIPAATTGFRYVGITISDPLNVYGYLRACVALVENAWQPQRNMPVGVGGGANVFGRPDTWVGAVGVQKLIRGLNIPLSALSPEEETQIVSLVRSLKGTGRIAILPQPAKPETWIHEALWGVFSQALTAIDIVDRQGKYRSLAFQFSEVDE